MKKLLLEMPWPQIDTNCPNCDGTIDQYDYFVELWNVEDKQKWLKKLMGINAKGAVPVICPFCETYFVHNKQTGESKIKDMPEVFKQNKETILDELVNRGAY